MPYSKNPPKTLDDLLDTVLLEMAATHPALTFDQESALKARLFEIMADAEGWERDPNEMAQRFRTAMDGL